MQMLMHCRDHLINQSELEDDDKVFYSVKVGAVVPDSEGIMEENEELVKLQYQDKELGPVVTFLEQVVLLPEKTMVLDKVCIGLIT